MPGPSEGFKGITSKDLLEEMTRDELKELVYQTGLFVEELKRRQLEDKLKYYEPHAKQLLFHQCPKRNRWALGGNRTGKTECGAAEGAWWTRGTHPYRKITRPMDGWIVSLTSEVQRDVAQAKFLSYINPDWIKLVKMRDGKADDPSNGIIDYMLIESIHGGLSRVGFKSCDQGRERFQGTSKDWIWFDEEPDEDVYLECLMRTLDCRGSIWGTMTPLKGLTWVYKAIWINEKHNPEAWALQMTWEDNPYLTKEAIALMEATLSEDELEARRDGNFVSVSGLIYPEFREDVHVIDDFAPGTIPPEWMETIVIDPGIDHPLAALWFCVDHDGNVFIVAEWHRSGWHVAAHMREIERISRELKWKRDSRGWLSCLMDVGATQRSPVSDQTVASAFRENRMNVNTRVNKNVDAGIDRVKEFLFRRKAEHYAEVDKARWPQGKPKMFICRSCKYTIQGFKDYRWGDNGAPKKENDDEMDVVRYFLMTKPSPNKVKQEEMENAIGRDKRIKAARLHRQNRAMGRRY